MVESIQVETLQVPNKNNEITCSIIWLHGLGACADDFLEIRNIFTNTNKLGVRYIFPNAPIKSVTINNNMQMPAWYDIYSLEMIDKEDINGLKSSSELIDSLIDAEIAKGISGSKIVLGGFSQGGALSMFAGLRRKVSLGSIVSLSAYLPDEQNFTIQDYPNNKDVPVLLCHGMFDPVVPFNLGQRSFDTLQQNLSCVEFKSYQLQHTVSIDELEYVDSFIYKNLA